MHITYTAKSKRFGRNIKGRQLKRSREMEEIFAQKQIIQGREISTK